ncbi:MULTISPECIES: extracellular solute-binding protein [unclassified Isoptericola]|uniref:extracellular solute-binding protein n=1 Tax=unclassified Isoptericola TaxID=2623355 RepID=UPI003648508A
MPPHHLFDRELTRRSAIGVLGLAGATAVGLSWPRLTGTDIPGRGSDVLTVAILGTSQDAASRASLVAAFAEEHPDIPVHIQAIQGADWGDFFSKILTMIAAGTPPDVVNVATEGAQLFASRLAEPLDDYVTRDAADLQEYFDDVHPSLVESFMYEGSLFQLPVDFNAANMYLNSSALAEAGLERPAHDWDHEDFRGMLRAMRDARGGGFVPYFWTNRLFGGLVPWLYVNDTSFLTEEKAPGGGWFWDRFYPDDAVARGGGYRWLHANADDPRVAESVEFLRQIVADDLGSRPEEGGGNALVGLFASGRIGTTPAGGYWVQGLHEAGMGADDFDVQYFPRWRTQRHQFGSAGYAIMNTSPRKDAAWEWIKFCATRPAMELALPGQSTTPARRSMVNAERYRDTGPEHWSVFYDTLDRFPTTGPIPAPPQQAAVETALIKNVSAAVSGGPQGVAPALAQLQRDLTTALGRTA